MKNAKLTLPKIQAFDWLYSHKDELIAAGIEIIQNVQSEKKYFIGKSKINIEINENKDWFDIYAIVTFGEFQIPFIELKNLILSGKKEFRLPNGEIAVIPESWITDYADLFRFSKQDKDITTLEKHHFSIIDELNN